MIRALGPGYERILSQGRAPLRQLPHRGLPAPGKAFIVSFIGQRGAGDRIATFMRERGLLEGRDLLLAA